MTDLVRRPGHLRRAGLAALVAACLVFVVGPAAFAQDEQPANGFVIRQIDGTDPADVGVTFVWTGNRADLEQMTLREEGRLAETEPPVPLAHAGVKRSLVIVLDRSASMESSGSLAAAKKGLTTLVSSLGDDEQAALVTFDSDVDVSQSLTSDHSAVRRAIDDVKVGAQESALFDAVKEGASLVGASDTVQPNIVLVTDGFDDISTTTHGQILGDLSRSSANLFAVSAGTLQPQYADLLGQLVERAGGQSVVAADAKGLDAAFGAVQSTLTNQYVVKYASTAEQGATEVELTVAGQTASKSFVPGSVARGSSSLDPKEVGGSVLPDFMATSTGKLLGIGMLFLAVALGVYAVASLMTKNESVLDNALNPYTDGWTDSEEDEDAGFSQTALFQRAVEFTEDFAEKQGYFEKVEHRLEQANLPLRAAEAIFVYVAAVVVLGLLLLVLQGFFVGILATVALALIPPAILNFLAKRRQKAFEAQLPDMLQLLSGSLRAGYSLMQGVEAVSQEVAEPMGKELRRVCTEARLGRELEESLDGVAARMDSADFEWAIMAIRIQREVGGNLAELLLTVGDTMINRERMRREVAALTAEGKISAIVLGILPPAISAVMYVVNPKYMQVLFSETMGNVMLGAGIVMMVVGFTWMMKTIKIEIFEEIMLGIGLVLLAGSIGLVIWAVLSQAEEKATVRASLRQLEGYQVENVRDQELLKPVGERAFAPILAALTGLGRRFTPVGYVDQVKRKHAALGIAGSDTVDRFLAIRVVSVALIPVMFILFFFVLKPPGMLKVGGFLLLSVLLVLGPDATLNRKVEERKMSIRIALPDVLDLLVISVEAGLGFEQALDRTVASVPGALTEEFSRMLGEVRAGASRADAMRNLEARCDVPELRSFVLAILQADTFGVSIGRVLRAQADEMRIKRRQLAQEQAQKAPVKMLIPMVFCIFPALFVVVLGPAIINISQNI